MIYETMKFIETFYGYAVHRFLPYAIDDSGDASHVNYIRKRRYVTSRNNSCVALLYGIESKMSNSLLEVLNYSSEVFF
jgi:hypothetical protein